jgi:hypothetical protein
VIGSEQKSADPGRKDSPFPAWLLRYANQAEQVPLASMPAVDPDQANEPGYTELNHFVEADSSGPADVEPSEDQDITD